MLNLLTFHLYLGNRKCKVLFPKRRCSKLVLNTSLYLYFIKHFRPRMGHHLHAKEVLIQRSHHQCLTYLALSEERAYLFTWHEYDV